MKIIHNNSWDTDLPIFSCQESLLKALNTSRTVVLSAEPGAGKTTYIPLFIRQFQQQKKLPAGKIVMLEPRRMATRNAASRMADLTLSKTGELIGYRMRGERKTSKETSIEVMTQGTLSRQLLNDPLLEDIGVLILDEFHERGLHSDYALALARDLLEVREDFYLIIMSATLDSKELQTYLPEAQCIKVSGRSFPLQTYYRACPKDSELLKYTVTIIKEALQHPESGDLLVFVDGLSSINRLKEYLENDVLIQKKNIHILGLHSSFSDKEQQRCLKVEVEAAQRIILSTNIAESSLTVPRIRTVIDTGRVKEMRFDNKLNTQLLENKSISQFSATQRAGRAARLNSGQVYRLWSKTEQSQKKSAIEPEVKKIDPAQLLLWQFADRKGSVHDFPWLTPLSHSHFKQAVEKLVWMHVLQLEQYNIDKKEQEYSLTKKGKVMMSIALPLQLSSLCFDKYGNFEGISALFALFLSNYDSFQEARSTHHTLQNLDIFESFFAVLTKPNFAQLIRENLLKKSKQLQQLLRSILEQKSINTRQRRWITAQLIISFPDKIAHVFDNNDQKTLRFTRGQDISAFKFNTTANEYLLVVQKHVSQFSYNQSKKQFVNSYLPITLQEIEAQLKKHFNQEKEFLIDSKNSRFIEKNTLTLGNLPIKTEVLYPENPLMNYSCRQLAFKNFVQWQPKDQQSLNSLARLNFAFKHDFQCAFKEKNQITEAGFEEQHLFTLAIPFIEHLNSVNSLKKLNWHSVVLRSLEYKEQQKLDQLFPEKLKLPSGREAFIDYTCTKTQQNPQVKAKLQEFFGLQYTPTIYNQQIKLALTMLSPNKKVLATTHDLPFFWENTYPQIRKEQRARYAKHPWPENPLEAAATFRTKKSQHYHDQE